MTSTPDQIEIPDGFKLLQTLTGAEGEMLHIEWSPDGKQLASCHTNEVVNIWDLESGSVMRNLRGIEGRVYSAAWSPDGERIAFGGADSKIQVWDLKKSTNIGEFESDGEVVDIVWSLDGQEIIYVDTKGYLALKKPGTGESVDFLQTGWGQILSLALSADGFLACGRGDNKVVLSQQTSNIPKEWAELTGHTGWVYDLCWSPDNTTLATASFDHSVRIWDAETKKSIRTLTGHTDFVIAVSFSKGGQLLASKSKDGTVKLWRCSDWQLVATLSEPTTTDPSLHPAGLAFHPRRPLLATLGAGDKSIRIWELDSSVLLRAKKESILAASNADVATAKDSLGFTPYVKAVAGFLTNSKTKPPLTLSIEGEWGSGKSSFMLQLQERLESDPQQLTIWFNAWRHDKEDALWAAFALEFLRKIANSKKLSRWQRLAGRIKLFCYRFNWKDGWLDLLRSVGLWLAVVLIAILVPSYVFLQGGDWIGGLLDKVESIKETWFKDAIKFTLQSGGALASVGAVIALWMKLKELVGSPLQINLNKYVESPDYEKRVAFIEDFHNDFEKIIRAYAGNRKVYIFIDDLDRCEVPKAADLMQALNLMISSDSGLIFIIGMDREKVAAGMAVKYEKIFPYLFATALPTESASPAQPKFDSLKALEYGYNFIEKFIQLPFRVPQPVNQDLSNLLDKLVGSEAGEPLKDNPSSSSISLFSRIFRARKLKPEAGTGTVEIDSGTASSNQAPSEQQSQAVAQALVDASVPASEEYTDKRIQLELDGESENSKEFRETVLKLAPVFENNPRRIKQFVNLFRLRAHIAWETGLLDTIEGLHPANQLNLQKLGKFVALSLKCPLLLADLEEEPTVLAVLQKFSIKRIEAGQITSKRARRWIERDDLVELLRAGCLDRQGDIDPSGNALYSLARIDVEKFLQVSPAVERSTPTQKTEDQSEKRDGEADEKKDVKAEADTLADTITLDEPAARIEKQEERIEVGRNVNPSGHLEVGRLNREDKLAEEVFHMMSERDALFCYQTVSVINLTTLDDNLARRDIKVLPRPLNVAVRQLTFLHKYSDLHRFPFIVAISNTSPELEIDSNLLDALFKYCRELSIPLIPVLLPGTEHLPERLLPVEYPVQEPVRFNSLDDQEAFDKLADSFNRLRVTAA